MLYDYLICLKENFLVNIFHLNLLLFFPLRLSIPHIFLFNTSNQDVLLFLINFINHLHHLKYLRAEVILFCYRNTLHSFRNYSHEFLNHHLMIYFQILNDLCYCFLNLMHYHHHLELLYCCRCIAFYIFIYFYAF